MKRKINKFFSSIRKIPDRKHYIEFITATLSIPVLLTVILVNLNNLQAQKEDTNPTPTQGIREVIIKEGGNTVVAPSLNPTNSDICKKEIGPISISSPKEAAVITENPVNFIIKYENKTYCSVVWSYRINGGIWSEFSSNSPTIYNMPSGNIKFELRVQSTVTDDQEQLERNFVYQGLQVTPLITSPFTPTPTL